MFNLFGNTNKNILKTSGYYRRNNLQEIYQVIVNYVNNNSVIDYEIVVINYLENGVECIVKYYM